MVSNKQFSKLLLKNSNFVTGYNSRMLRTAIFNQPCRYFNTGGNKPDISPGEPRVSPNQPPDPTDTSPGYFSDEDSTSFDSDRKFSNFILFTGAFALIIIYMYSTVTDVQRKREQKSQNVGKAKYTGKANIGGPWLLYDTEGNVFTHKNLEGKYYLIYFGFTMCPDVCPISLNKVAKAKRMVQKSKEYRYFDLESIFVSLDPDRDTPERIKRYCKIFDKDMVGLTHKSNNDPELKSILKSFKIHSSKIFLTEEEQREDEESMKAVAPEVIEAMQDQDKKEGIVQSTQEGSEINI